MEHCVGLGVGLVGDGVHSELAESDAGVVCDHSGHGFSGEVVTEGHSFVDVCVLFVLGGAWEGWFGVGVF